MRTGRTPQWPNYFEKQYADRRLAILEGNTLYVEGTGRFAVDSLATFIDLVFSQNCLSFCSSLTNAKAFLWLAESVHSDDADVLSSKDGDPLAIIYHGAHNQTRWLVPASTWDRRLDTHFLADMRAIYSYFKVGTKPTPGSLGRAVLRRSLYQQKEGRHTAPNVIALDYLRAHGYGGRCDTLVQPFKETGETYPVLLSMDMASGYLAHFMRLPTGTSHWFIGGHVSPYFTYFAECIVTIYTELALGPFPMRTGRKESKIVYPTLPGRYHTFLWKEQIERARQMGCTVTVTSGVGWADFTTCTTDFCRFMHHSRIVHTGLPIEDDDKKIAVSTIGGFGMKQTFYRLTGEDNERYPSVLDDRNIPLDFFIEEYNDYQQPSMLHWRDYTIMLCNGTLFDYALPYAEVGRLIMTNYDELLIVATDEQKRYAQKHSLEALMCQMGDLRWQQLTNVKIHGDRSLECDQKVVRPGVQRIEEVV